MNENYIFHDYGNRTTKNDLVILYSNNIKCSTHTHIQSHHKMNARPASSASMEGHMELYASLGFCLP